MTDEVCQIPNTYGSVLELVLTLRIASRRGQLPRRLTMCSRIGCGLRAGSSVADFVARDLIKP